MSSETRGKRLKNIEGRLKRLEDKYDLSLDYEIETDEKISNLYNTLKIVSAKLGVDMDYDYRKANIKKRSKRKKNKSRKKRKTRRN